MEAKSDGYNLEIKELPTLKAMTRRFVTSGGRVTGDVADNFGIVMRHIVASGGAAEVFFLISHDEAFDPERMDLEANISVPELLPDSSEVRGREMPGGSFAGVIHKGPYESLGGAYEEAALLMGEKGLKSLPPMREIYLNDPDDTPPEELLTEVLFPIDSRPKALGGRDALPKDGATHTGHRTSGAQSCRS
ncbi:MAG: GyrI-like domain-containing protein [Deltaproteobacteria bacterium]|nr:GyrI-like domain-containing protein [Deltaproteobacteria bacterium]